MSSMLANGCSIGIDMLEYAMFNGRGPSLQELVVIVCCKVSFHVALLLLYVLIDGCMKLAQVLCLLHLCEVCALGTCAGVLARGVMVQVTYVCP